MMWLLVVLLLLYLAYLLNGCQELRTLEAEESKHRGRDEP